MRNSNVHFNDEVVKEFRRLVRNSNLGNEFKAALSKIYKVGFENGFQEAVRQASEYVKKEQDANNQSASAGNDNDRVVLQPSSNQLGKRTGVVTIDSNSDGTGSTVKYSVIDEA